MDFLIGLLRYLIPIFSIGILATCVISLLRNRPRVHKMAELINKTDNSVIPIEHWETSIGRSKSCDVPLQLPTVSRFHGVISKRSKSWIVTDTFSQSGITVNDKRVKNNQPIFDGDKIMFGEIPLIFKCDDALSEESKKSLRQNNSASNKSYLVDVNTRRPYYLNAKQNIIGREEDSNILFEDISVSKHHARMFQTPRGWAISDLDSSNGTRLNGRFIREPQLVFDEDRLTFGNVTVIFYEK